MFVQAEGEAGLVLGIIFLILFLGSLVVIAFNVASMRATLNRLLFPAGLPRTIRACPHCMMQIHAQASVCPFCNRESEPWSLRDGVWWRRTERGEEFFDTAARQWRSGTSQEPASGGPL